MVIHSKTEAAKRCYAGNEVGHEHTRGYSRTFSCEVIECNEFNGGQASRAITLFEYSRVTLAEIQALKVSGSASIPRI